MTPIGELRASIPLGLATFDLPIWQVFVVSVAGNLVPVPFLFFGLRRSGSWFEAQPNIIGRLLRWRTHRIRKRYGARAARYDFLMVTLLVAIPLPLTGAWTASLAIWVFQVPFRRGVPAIALGVLIAATLVTTLTVMGIEFFDRID
jgi:uncharacterized membrane protein